MYIPRPFRETEIGTLMDFVRANPLGVLVTGTASGLKATHLPLIVKAIEGECGELHGHVAVGNAQARLGPGESSDALVIFSDPGAHISASWYPSKQERGTVVPTWDYIAVHAYGTLTLRPDTAFLRAHLDDLTAVHESARGSAWRPQDAPPAYIDQQLKGIVGVCVRVSRWEGSWKLSQNKSAADIDGVLRGLSETGNSRDEAVAEMVAKRRPPGSMNR